MRRLIIVTACLALLLFAAALPAFAADGDLLGSGATAPDGGGQAAAAPVEVSVASTSTTQTVGEDVLAATGLDSGAMLVVGLGLMTAGGTAVLTSRKRAKQ